MRSCASFYSRVLHPSWQMLVPVDFYFYDLNRCFFLTPMSYQLVTLTDTLQEQTKSQPWVRSGRKKAESVSLSAEIFTLARQARHRAEHPPTVAEALERAPKTQKRRS